MSTGESITPMLRQYLKIKSENPESILMFRLGDFYEMFFDDAVLASNVLDITLTSRNRNDPNPIPLCGVPYHSVEPYIARLLETGHKVAICDQVEDPKTAKGVVRREVTRVITPGVIVDGLSLDAKTNNFLAAACVHENRIGMAIADASTGFFQTAEFASVERVFEEISRAAPREIVFSPILAGNTAFKEKIKRRMPGIVFTEFPKENFETAAIERLEGASQIILNCPVAAMAAAGALSYIEATQKGRAVQIRAIAEYSCEKNMRLDEATKRNLELVKTMRDASHHGSLLDALDKTSTAAGGRKLKRWMLYPLTDSQEINARLDAVDQIISEPKLLRSIPDDLSKIADIERITSRAATGLANARDLVSLKNSLAAISELKDHLKGTAGLLAVFAVAIDCHEALSKTIGEKIADEPPLALRDGGLVKTGVSAELDELRDIIAHGKDFIARLEAKEKEATGIGSLKIRYNKVFGYYIEVTHTHREKIPAHYIRKQTLANAERFITPELKEYEEKILGAQDKSRELEFEIFSAVRAEVASCAATLLQTADAIASIDVLASFARTASEYNYVRPVVDEGSVVDIRDGRHPIVERINPIERFVPNDVLLDESESRMMMITGPNMAGKSTVMRQTALIVLMSQIGSFVPAKSAKIGVVDRIFTRVGASDALALGQSTFMVEMSEAALILNEATKKSLIIIDEIGRGTSTFDGLAIAWAVAEDIHDRVGARTMFATHYHELTDLALTKTGIRNMNIAVKEWNGEVIFLRKLVAGATSRSYGIAVAKLAGLPAGVIDRAGEVLENLESGELDEVGKPRIASHHNANPPKNPAQYQLFSAPLPHEISTRLKEIDTSVITPIEALNILHEIKGKLFQ